MAQFWMAVVLHLLRVRSRVATSVCIARNSKGQQQRPISLMVRTVDSDSTGPGSIPGLAFLPAFSSHANHAIPTPATRAHFLVRKREFGSNALREMKRSFCW